MALTNFNSYLSRIAAGYWANYPVWGEIQTATTTLASNPTSIQRVGYTKTLPSLPSGVTNFIASEVNISCSTVNVPILVAKLVSLGTYAPSGATGAFTDGSAMPTITELGVSRQICGPILMEVTTALAAAPGTITVTYKDQDGNTAEAAAGQALPASAAAGTCGWVILNSTDYGATDITTAAIAGATSGVGSITFWGVIPLTIMAGSPRDTGTIVTDNLLVNNLNPVRMGASDVIGFFTIGNTTTKAITGNILIVGDS